jgi:site-specific recombinase XerD
MILEVVMTKLIRDFERWLRDADKSDQTIRAYVSALNRFDAWFNQTNRKSLTTRS